MCCFLCFFLFVFGQFKETEFAGNFQFIQDVWKAFRRPTLDWLGQPKDNELTLDDIDMYKSKDIKSKSDKNGDGRLTNEYYYSQWCDYALIRIDMQRMEGIFDDYSKFVKNMSLRRHNVGLFKEKIDHKSSKLSETYELLWDGITQIMYDETWKSLIQNSCKNFAISKRNGQNSIRKICLVYLVEVLNEIIGDLTDKSVQKILFLTKAKTKTKTKNTIKTIGDVDDLTKLTPDNIVRLVFHNDQKTLDFVLDSVFMPYIYTSGKASHLSDNDSRTAKYLANGLVWKEYTYTIMNRLTLLLFKCKIYQSNSFKMVQKMLLIDDKMVGVNFDYLNIFYEILFEYCVYHQCVPKYIGEQTAITQFLHWKNDIKCFDNFKSIQYEGLLLTGAVKRSMLLYCQLLIKEGFDMNKYDNTYKITPYGESSAAIKEYFDLVRVE